jgi:hypothetical protein
VTGRITRHACGRAGMARESRHRVELLRRAIGISDDEPGQAERRRVRAAASELSVDAPEDEEQHGPELPQRGMLPSPRGLGRAPGPAPAALRHRLRLVLTAEGRPHEGPGAAAGPPFLAPGRLRGGGTPARAVSARVARARAPVEAPAAELASQRPGRGATAGRTGAPGGIAPILAGRGPKRCSKASGGPPGPSLSLSKCRSRPQPSVKSPIGAAPGPRLVLTTPPDVPGNTRERSCMARRRRSFSALAGPGVGNGRQDSERAYPFELPLYARIGPEADRPRDSRYTPIVSP